MSVLERPFIVEDIKQYSYCPRIVFYRWCMPGVRPRTFSMDAGHDDHIEARRNARRRTYAQMGLESGKREFDVDIVDTLLNLHGRLDEVITTESGAILPVEYKASEKLTENHRLQVVAYALLLEESHRVEISQAYVYLIPLRKARKITIKPEEKYRLRMLLNEMSAMVARENMPDPTDVWSRCQGCEFRRFCNDV
jgi:CRISPR-associated exonuclease Cas4